MVNRVLKYGLVAVVCALPALLDTTPAHAISWGKKMSNGKVCRVLLGTHNHYGFSGLQSTKAAARAAAVKRWSGFTAWEYGKAWGNFSLAQGKHFPATRPAEVVAGAAGSPPSPARARGLWLKHN